LPTDFDNLSRECTEHLEWVIELGDDFDESLVTRAKELKSKLEGVSEQELKQVIRAMDQFNLYGGTAADHWYECPNGHPYFIGECGQAMQTSTCPECGETVGGGSHTLLSSNRQAADIRSLARQS